MRAHALDTGAERMRTRNRVAPLVFLTSAAFHFLADDARQATAHLHRFRGGAVLHAVLGEAPPDEDVLANVVLEVAPGGPAALHGDDGNGLEGPGFRAARALHVHVKVSVRILP